MDWNVLIHNADGQHSKSTLCIIYINSFLHFSPYKKTLCPTLYAKTKKPGNIWTRWIGVSSTPANFLDEVLC